MITQAQLDLFAPPAPPAGEIDRLCDYLATRPGWTTAKEITQAIDLSDRQIRNLARHHRDRILSAPGTPGYKLVSRATLEEITRTADKLRSQAREMLAGSIKLRRIAHAAIR
jgi:hypothetical protein